MAVAMIICDQIITEERTHKKSLLGCFNNVNSPVFPTQPITCFVFVALTNGQGAHEGRLKCTNQDARNETVFELGGPIIFINPMQTIEMGFRLVNLSFAKPGLHVIEFWCGESLILQRRFSVKQIENKEL